MIEVAEKSIWQMTQPAFEKLLSALDADTERAGEKYLALQKNLTRFFEVRGLITAQEAADEVINRLARKLESVGELENVNAYALGIARLVALELRRSPLQKTSNELPEIGVSPADPEPVEKDRKLDCLEKCLGELPEESRELIVGYYKGEKRAKIENRARLARNLNASPNALRNRAVRLRHKLENCIKNCLKKL